MEEDKISSSAYFLTLTYDTDNCPISSNGFMSLRKKDLQDFFKRLRKSQKKSGIKYYAAGEYGTTRNRPHYHVILFNTDLSRQYNTSSHNLLLLTGLDGKTKVNHLQWNKGETSVGLVSGASVGYTLKYINKKYFTPKHKNDDRQKEFSLQSKGLGKSYLSPTMVQWHLADYTNRAYVPIENGKKASMPRYYKERIFSLDQIATIGDVHRERIAKKESTIADVLSHSRNHQMAIEAQQRLHKLNIKKDDNF